MEDLSIRTARPAFLKKISLGKEKFYLQMDETQRGEMALLNAEDIPGLVTYKAGDPVTKVFAGIEGVVFVTEENLTFKAFFETSFPFNIREGVKVSVKSGSYVPWKDLVFDLRYTPTALDIRGVRFPTIEEMEVYLNSKTI